jgi:hypothetical protein
VLLVGVHPLSMLERRPELLQLDCPDRYGIGLYCNRTRFAIRYDILPNASGLGIPHGKCVHADFFSAFTWTMSACMN